MKAIPDQHVKNEAKRYPIYWNMWFSLQLPSSSISSTLHTYQFQSEAISFPDTFTTFSARVASHLHKETTHKSVSVRMHIVCDGRGTEVILIRNGKSGRAHWTVEYTNTNSTVCWWPVKSKDLRKSYNHKRRSTAVWSIGKVEHRSINVLQGWSTCAHGSRQYFVILKFYRQSNILFFWTTAFPLALAAVHTTDGIHSATNKM